MRYLYVNFQYLVEIDHDPATWKSGLREWERDAPEVLEELQDEEKQGSDKEEDADRGGTIHRKVPKLNSFVSLMSDIKNLCADEGFQESFWICLIRPMICLARYGARDD